MIPAYSRPYHLFHRYYLSNLAGNGLEYLRLLINKKRAPFWVRFLYQSATSYPPRPFPAKYFRRLRA